MEGGVEAEELLFLAETDTVDEGGAVGAIEGAESFERVNVRFGRTVGPDVW